MFLLIKKVYVISVYASLVFRDIYFTNYTHIESELRIFLISVHVVSCGKNGFNINATDVFFSVYIHIQNTTVVLVVGQKKKSLYAYPDLVIKRYTLLENGAPMTHFGVII